MSDLISRQAAIDAVESAKTARTPDGEIYVAKLNAEMNIRILPSAQPEPDTRLYSDGFDDGYKQAQQDAQPEIIRCKDCKHFHLNVFGDEIGIGKPYDCLIVGHEMCDAWGDGCKTDPEGFCFMGERRRIWEHLTGF